MVALSSIVFPFTAALSAFLLFWIQPLFAKMVVPLFGGGAGVWNSLLLFFQLFLFLGYAYAFFLMRIKAAKTQFLIQGSLCVGSLFFLPISLNGVDIQALSDMPTFAILAISFLSLGVPFFVISAFAPLMQGWSARLLRHDTADPYQLYAVSNLGSLAALLSYPFLIEPFAKIAGQVSCWTLLYVVLMLALAVCGAIYMRAPEPPAAVPVQAQQNYFLWFLLAFAPSSILHGVSVYISNDIASIPLLWIVPLSLYLISFILPFTKKKRYDFEALVNFLPLLLAFVFILPLWVPVTESLMHIFAHLGLFFMLSLLCHHHLRATAPDKAHLGVFYLFVAAGGVTGGIFNVLIAPHLFNLIAEYPLSLALGAFLVLRNRGIHWKDIPFALLQLSLLTAVLFVLYTQREDTDNYMMRELLLIGCSFILAGVFSLSRKSSIRSAATIIAVSLFTAMTSLSSLYGIGASLMSAGTKNKLLTAERNFYGIVRVVHDPELNLHLYYNGSVMHAGQSQEPAGRASRSYFLYRLFHHDYFREKPIAILGLGPGQMLRYADSVNRFDFFEINPAVARIAQNENLFTYWRDAKVAEKNIILGDGRLMLQKQPEKKYGTIISTAFNSNTLPFHLVTREAIALYLSRLQKGGVLLFIAPANYFDFRKLFSGLAANLDLDIRYMPFMERGRRQVAWFAVMRRDEVDGFSNLPWIVKSSWSKIEPNSMVHPWTDDFYNVLSVLK